MWDTDKLHQLTQILHWLWAETVIWRSVFFLLLSVFFMVFCRLEWLYPLRMAFLLRGNISALDYTSSACTLWCRPWDLGSHWINHWGLDAKMWTLSFIWFLQLNFLSLGLYNTRILQHRSKYLKHKKQFQHTTSANAKVFIFLQLNNIYPHKFPEFWILSFFVSQFLFKRILVCSMLYSKSVVWYVALHPVRGAAPYFGSHCSNSMSN